MLENMTIDGYGRELFFEFVPGSVRHVSSPLGVPILSGALLAEFAYALQGPVLEATYPGPVVLSGLMRAAKYADAVLAISMPASRPGEVLDRQRNAQILAVASEVAFDRPLILVVRAQRLADVDDGGIERMAEWVLSEVEFGFTSIGFRPQDISVDRVARLSQAASQLVDLGIGVEIELDGGASDGLLLAEVEEAGLPLAAVRGGNDGDELGGGLLVIDPLSEEIPESAPCRVMVDGFLLKALARALPDAEAGPLLERAGDHSLGGVSSALLGAASFIEELDAPLQTRIEAMVYSGVLSACRMLGAGKVATDLLDALAAEIDR